MRFDRLADRRTRLVPAGLGYTWVASRLDGRDPLLLERLARLEREGGAGALDEPRLQPVWDSLEQLMGRDPADSLSFDSSAG